LEKTGKKRLRKRPEKNKANFSGTIFKVKTGGAVNCASVIFPFIILPPVKQDPFLEFFRVYCSKNAELILFCEVSVLALLFLREIEPYHALH
jgi:hypothetical protein